MEYKCNFTPSGWNQEDWLLVRSPRWEAHSTWRQEADCIANNFPEDLTAEDTQMGRDRTGETYLSMLYKKPVSGSGMPAFAGRGRRLWSENLLSGV